MKYVLNKCTYSRKRSARPYIKIINNLLTEVNDEFEELTGYSKEDIIDKSSEEIEKILRIDSQIGLKNIKDEFEGYLFTKNNEPREVKIKCDSNKLNEYIYTFKEKRNSRAEDHLLCLNSILHDDMVSIAVYSKIGLALKFNIKYLSYFGKFDNFNDNEKSYLGKQINDIFYEFITDEYTAINFDGSFNKPLHLNEVQYKLKDGNYVYFDTSFMPVSIKGELKYIIHRLMDVTERVLKRKQIEQQKQELEIVLENMSDETIIFNNQGQYLRLNKEARESKMFDYVKAKSSMGFHKQAETYEMDGSRISFENLPINEVIRGNKVNKRIIRKNKKNNKTMYCDITGNPIYDNEGNFVAGILLMRNIDERVKEEENLYKKSQYESLYKVVENLNQGYTSVSYPSFKVKYLNKKSFEDLQNNNGVKSLTSALGKNMFTIFNYSTDEIEEIKSNLKDTIKYNKGVYANIRKTNVLGEEVFIKVIYQPIYNLNKKVEQVIAISFDVTEEIKSKIELEEALKVQDEIYANIAHELKTPLNVIYSANQMQEFYARNFMLEEIKDKLKDYNSSIKQNCLRLTKLINNIVDMSKIKTGHLKVELVNEDIIEIVENIVTSVSDYIKSAGLKIIFDANIDEKIIACDPDKIERIILNLISNAIKFSNVNGEIIVRILNKKDKVEIYVKDTGLGIEEKNLNSIFERFYQVDKSLSRNAEGSGIGLSLVKSLVELHGGNISVISEVGKGSEFKIELPNVTVEKFKDKNHYIRCNSKIEMLNIEFSDIYSI